MFKDRQPGTPEEAQRLEAEQRKAAARAERDAADKAARAQVARLRAAGVPERHLDVLLHSWDPTAYTAKAVAAWQMTPYHTLVLGGAKGTGKSVAACWLVKEGPRRQYPDPRGSNHHKEWPPELRPRYVHSARLARLPMYYHGSDAPELDLLERCALLVIDDVGGVSVGRESDWIARFDSITAIRADNCLDTIITTNMRIEDQSIAVDGTVKRTIPGFRTIYGERLLDRMRGDGRCWVEVAGESFRVSEPWDVEAAVREEETRAGAARPRVSLVR